MKPLVNRMSIITAIIAFVSSFVGLFYTSGGEKFIVQNIYGQKIELYGDGIYAYNSILKVGATKGTDLAVIIIVAMLISVIVFNKKIRGSAFLQVGFLCALLYIASCTVFGITFNRMFPIYLIYFACALFTFIFAVIDLFKSNNLDDGLYNTTLKGTAVFMIIGGCSVLVWLSVIIPAIVTGNPMENIEIYTTEPTFILDLGIILPSAVGCGILLLKRNTVGYKLTPVLLTLISCVGLCVIAQSIMQASMGIELPLGQIFGLVGSFVILGSIAIALNFRLLKYAK